MESYLKIAIIGLWCTLSVFLLVRLSLKGVIKNINLKRKLKLTGAGFVWFLVIFAALNILAIFVPEVKESYSVISDRYNIAETILLTIFISPVLEEILFRYVFYKGLLKIGFSDIHAIFIVTVLFAFSHIEPIQQFYAFLSGMILMHLYNKNKNLLEPMLFHVSFNTFNLLSFYIFNYVT